MTRMSNRPNVLGRGRLRRQSRLRARQYNKTYLRRIDDYADRRFSETHIRRFLDSMQARFYYIRWTPCYSRWWSLMLQPLP
jgi:hypothetical protein